MKFFICIFFIFLHFFILYAKKNTFSVYDYLQKYAKEAIKEMEEFKIPASIKLAQGILESSSGNSLLALIANNHFGIKCGKTWKGDVYYHNDDYLHECFRKYFSPFQSFIDHSKFLQQKRYKKLFLISITDYKSWAKGLKKFGYATSPNYDKNLIDEIEKYQLWRFDKESSKNFENHIQEYLIKIGLKCNDMLPIKKIKINFLSSIIPKYELYDDEFFPNARILYHENNGIKYIILENKENLEKISKIYNISTKKLKYYNDINNKNILIPGQYLFLEKKKNSGIQNFYKVLKGETMYFISQKLGIQLKKLYYYNNININKEPQKGQILFLKKNIYKNNFKY